MSGTWVEKPYVHKSDLDIEAIPWSKADNVAKAQFVSKVRRTQTTFQGGVFLGELSKTIVQIRNPVRSLRKGFHSYLDAVKSRASKVKRSRSSSRKKREALSDMVSDTWLEYSFGWVPLLSDIDDAAKALAESGTKFPPWKMVKGYGSERIQWRDSILTVSSATLPSMRYSSKQFTKAEVIYYGQVGVNTSSVANPQRVGFDSSNWVPTLWELVPYSFLIDYFANIDDIIDAVTLTNSGIRWISRTIRLADEAWAYNPEPRYLSSSTVNILPYAASGSTGNYYERAYVQRAKYNGSLVPNLQFSLPTSPKKLLNMAALVVRSKDLSRSLHRL
jgi:hypothetical protein